MSKTSQFTSPPPEGAYSGRTSSASNSNNPSPKQSRSRSFRGQNQLSGSAGLRRSSETSASDDRQVKRSLLDLDSDSLRRLPSTKRDNPSTSLSSSYTGRLLSDKSEPVPGSAFRTYTPQYNYSALPDEELLRMLADHEAKRNKSAKVENSQTNLPVKTTVESAKDAPVGGSSGSVDSVTLRSAEGSSSSSASRRRRMQMTRSLTLPDESTDFNFRRRSLRLASKFNDRTELEEHAPKIAQPFVPPATLQKKPDPYDQSFNDKSEADRRAERIARYKEERRKELSSIVASRSGQLKRSSTIDLPPERDDSSHTSSSAWQVQPSAHSSAASALGIEKISVDHSDLKKFSKNESKDDSNLALTKKSQDLKYEIPSRSFSFKSIKANPLSGSTLTAYGENPLYQKLEDKSANTLATSSIMTVKTNAGLPEKAGQSEQQDKSKYGSKAGQSEQQDKSKYGRLGLEEHLSKMDTIKQPGENNKGQVKEKGQIEARQTAPSVTTQTSQREKKSSELAKPEIKPIRYQIEKKPQEKPKDIYTFEMPVETSSQQVKNSPLTQPIKTSKIESSQPIKTNTLPPPTRHEPIKNSPLQTSGITQPMKTTTTKSPVNPESFPIPAQQKVPLSFAKPQVCLGDVSNRRARLGAQKRVEDDLDMMIEEMLEHRPNISPSPQADIVSTPAVSNSQENVCVSAPAVSAPQANISVSTTVSAPRAGVTAPQAGVTTPRAGVTAPRAGVTVPTSSASIAPATGTLPDSSIKLPQSTGQPKPDGSNVSSRRDPVDIKVTEDSTDSDKPMFDAMKIISRQSRLRCRNDSSSSSDSLSPSPSRLSPRAARRLKRAQHPRDSESSTSTIGQESRSRGHGKQRRGVDSSRLSVEEEMITASHIPEENASFLPDPPDGSSGRSSPSSLSRPSSREGKRRFRSRELDALQQDVSHSVGVDISHLAVPTVVPSVRKSRKRDKSSARKSTLNRVQENHAKEAVEEVSTSRPECEKDQPIHTIRRLQDPSPTSTAQRVQDTTLIGTTKVTEKDKHFASIYADSPRSNAFNMLSSKSDLPKSAEKGRGIATRSEVLSLSLAAHRQTPSVSSPSLAAGRESAKADSQSASTAQTISVSNTTTAVTKETPVCTEQQTAKDDGITNIREATGKTVSGEATGEAASSSAAAVGNAQPAPSDQNVLTTTSKQRFLMSTPGPTAGAPVRSKTSQGTRAVDEANSREKTCLDREKTIHKQSVSLDGGKNVHKQSTSLYSDDIKYRLATNVEKSKFAEAKCDKTATSDGTTRMPKSSSLISSSSSSSSEHQFYDAQEYVQPDGLQTQSVHKHAEDKTRYIKHSDESRSAKLTAHASKITPVIEPAGRSRTEGQITSPSISQKQQQQNEPAEAKDAATKVVTSGVITSQAVTLQVNKDNVTDSQLPNNEKTSSEAAGGEAEATGKAGPPASRVDNEDDQARDKIQDHQVTDQEKSQTTDTHIPVICGQSRKNANQQDTKKTPSKKFLTGAKDFSQLVRRFSGSEGSSSEPSRKEEGTTQPKRFFLRKPEIPEELRNAGGENSTLRKTPERTQSLRDRRQKTPPRDGIPRRSSFNTGEAVRRKYQTNTQPDEQLVKILNRRSRNLEEYEEELAKNKTPSAEAMVSQFESSIKKKVDSTPDDMSGVVDKEMLSVLLSRRAKTDSDSASEDQMPDTHTSKHHDGGRRDSADGLQKTAEDKPYPILKQKADADRDTKVIPKVVPILKKKDSVDAVQEENPAAVTTVTSILKHTSPTEENQKVPVSDSDIRPILKHSADVEPEAEIPSILRRKSSGEESDSSPHKPLPILKRDSSEDADTSPVHKTHSILMKRDTERSSAAGEAVSKLPSILKRLDDGAEGHPGEAKAADSEMKSKSPPGGDIKLKSVLRKSSLKLQKENSTPSCDLDPELAAVLQRRKLSVDDEASDQSAAANVSDVSMESPLPEKSGLSVKQEVHLPTVPDDSATLNDVQLLEKLSDTAAMRRKKFQSRNRNDWRVRTQPVTEEEVSVADSLDSVALFRIEINKKASLTLFSDLQTQKPVPQRVRGKKGRGLEYYPENYRKTRHKDRRTAERYKTLPITLSELAEISETEPIQVQSPLTEGAPHSHRLLTPSPRVASHSASGGESDIDLDRLVAVNLDDAKQQVAAEKLNRESQQNASKSKFKSKGSRRFQDHRKRSERSLTQPITEEEVKEAADMSDERQASSPAGLASEAKKDSTSTGESGDELSKLSISEKMKLFSQRPDDKTQSPKPSSPRTHRRGRRMQSRFKTQPVTPEELEKASRISPLAATLIKPPDPDIIQGLPLKDQRAMMAQWAEKTLSASKPISLQSGSKVKPSTSPRRGSAGEVSADQPSVKGILRIAEASTDQPHSILKSPPETEKAVHSILKTEHPPPEKTTLLISKDSTTPSDQHRGILKHFDSRKESETRGILKKDSSFEKHVDKESSHSVLKREVHAEQREVKSILKDSSVEAIDSAEKTSDADQQMSASQTVTTSENIQATRKTISSATSEPAGQSTSTSSSASNATENSPERGRTIKNEAIAARKKKRDMRKAGERFHTQPIESEETKKEETHATSKRVTERHLTQPITKIEHEQVKDEAEDMNRASISERLAALQKDGEEGWRKRVSPLREITSSTRNTSRPTSIVDRLSRLEESKGGWKHRVGETDAKQFTVAGKMAKAGKSNLNSESPLMSKKKISPRKDPLRSKQDLDSSESSTPPLSPTKVPMSRYTLGIEEKPASSAEEEKPAPVKREVPKANDETFSSFFKTTTTVQVVSEKTEVSIDDFNHVFLEAADILQITKRTRPIRKQTGSRNPLKKLAMRDDIQHEYEEVQSGVAERELKRLKRDQIASGASLAESALAGLASKENFSQVALKKTDSFTAGSYNKHEPFKNIMLIQVKGRRHVQARLVEPKAKSINSGDCFVLVISDRVFLWTGEYANVIEKAKASEMALSVHQKKDLGCRSVLPDVQSIMEKKSHSAATKAFWETLGGESKYQETGPPDEDELYEMYTVATNMIYKVRGEELVPCEENWGNMPKYGMLDSSEVFVLDFGSELYVWTGKKVPFNKRKNAVKLATKLWEQGYDYSECDINPLCPMLLDEDAEKPVMKALTRPDWALFGKINQDMETCLFKAKFIDWPDSSQIIKVKGQDSEGESKVIDPSIDLKPFDVTEMLKTDKKSVTLMLDGSNVGRGTKWIEEQDGLRREFEVDTLGIVVWHVLEFDISKVDISSHGQFHEGDTYVVRWQYMIRQAGLKTLKGEATRHSQTGRERCAYFFWQGKESGITEKGASALMTVELDEERGPQVRVVQGKEPPAFMNLFKGKMMVHIGKREEEETNTQGPWRLYIVRNELLSESFLQEVMCEVQSLRSLASFLLLNVYSGLLYVWHGCKASKSTRTNALTAARSLKKSCPAEVGLHKKASVLIMEMEEGSEKRDFCKTLGLSDETRSNYHSLLKHTRLVPHTPRLFHMTSVSGTFVATEIQNVMKLEDAVTSCPFLQSDLYKASQPALFLLDHGDEVYLWQGWWPEGDEEIENVNTGSAQARFTVNRKCAMETTLNYCQERNSSRPPTAYLIHAGVEPVRFTNLFPYWEPDDVVTEIAEKSGKKLQRTLVKDVFKQLNRTRFTLEELRAENLPEGVDTLRLESYLDDAEFEAALGMTRKDFCALPSWKQANLKKSASLF